MVFNNNKILRLITLAAYLNVLALTTFHIHHHESSASTISEATDDCKHHSDPFANSDSLCSVLEFSKVSYTFAAIFDSNNFVFNANHLTIYKNGKIAFQSYFSINKLRGPPLFI